MCGRWQHNWSVFTSFEACYGKQTDDGNTIGRFSQVLKLAAVSNPVFKLDGNLDFNMGTTMILAKGSTTRHVYERDQHFLENDPDLQGIANDFTSEMFSVQVVEVLGTPLGTDVYIMDFVTQKCIKIIRDVEKIERTFDRWSSPFSDDKILYEHTDPVHECQHYPTISGAILIGAAPSCRHVHRKRYPQERYSWFIHSLGQG